MDLSKKGLRTGLLCLALVVGLGLFNEIKLGLHYPGLLFNCLVLCAVYVAWGFSVYRRFPQKQMRFYLSLLVMMFVLLNLLRTAKYGFVGWNGSFQRFLWYGYYLPIVFGPLLMFRAALSIGKPNDYCVSRFWNGLYVPAALLVCGILTNDLHQAAFRFAPGFADWQSNYTRGPLYFTVVAWIALLTLGVLISALRSTVSRRLLKTVWLPLAVLALCVLFGLGYVADLGPFARLGHVIQFPEYICLCTIAFWESLVAARIVTSNNGYPDVFAASMLRAGLADPQYRVQQTAADGFCPTPEQLRAAENGELLLPDGNTLLKVRPVRGGRFYWLEDITELRRLNESLGAAAEELAEEHKILRAKTELDESRRATAMQLQLYDRVTESLRPQLKTLNAWLEALPEDEAAFCTVLRRSSVLLAYCKRRSNLLLQAEEHPELTGEALRQCFDESARALSLSGVASEIEVEPLLRFSARDAAALYEAFETVLEQVLPALGRLDLTLTAGPDGVAVLRLTAALKEEAPALSQRLQQTLNGLLQGVAARFVLNVKNQREGVQPVCD